MSIPKIIHYCWFGKKTIPAQLVKYIDSWKKCLPEYEIIEWNENNFDVFSYGYVKAAYDAGKYAFVSDYVRLWALKKYGGIYFDTDIQVLKKFDELLGHQGIFCFESYEKVMTAFMAVTKENPVIVDFLNYYENKTFDLACLEPNTVPLTEILEKRGLIVNGKNQVLEGDILVFSNEYFNAFDFSKSMSLITKNTYTIHHCLGSWCSLKERVFFKVKRLLGSVLEEKYYDKLKRLKKQVTGEEIYEANNQN